ncbi:hypothetical protein FZEAL_5946 [Fusarium zealandicum]|uniref:Histidine acid phosphatase n=1 Tax=Fusarium zealandicum TaxID=1053134 RepID=A0A8H4UJP4_9HYPO|nr:hypothetical protein FZEAL_5946 [Fusarium zealandicum]
MVQFKRLLVATPFISGVAAQMNATGQGDKVWAVVAFINHGETTPSLSDLRGVLTPEGAQQMRRQGSAFRARYLKDSVDSSDLGAIQISHLENFDVDVINNDDLAIFSQADEWVSAGAISFMQGLYPPLSDTFANDTGGDDLARDFSVGDNKTDYPLNGYQYPSINTASIFDPISVALQGTESCSAWLTETSTNMTNIDELQTSYKSSLPFYQELFSNPPLAGTIGLQIADFWHADVIWDFVDYMYRHNETVYQGLQDEDRPLGPNETLSYLEAKAALLHRSMNSYLDREDDDEPLNVLYSIAGRTLAYGVTELLPSAKSWEGDHRKLTLMFGSLEPIVSFISLSGLLTPQSITQEPFSVPPKPGAALVFELFGEDPDFPDRQPPYESLRVKMSYRASADEDAPFARQPLFDSGPDSVSYDKFMSTMQEMGRTPSEWCNVCGSRAPWCDLGIDLDDFPAGSSSLEPAIAGVIGAVATMAVLVLIFAGLFFIGGFRLARKTPQEQPQNNNAVGGFKGPERKEGDPDVTVTKAGIHHERVGSWELRGGSSLPPTSSIVTKDFPENRRSMDDDDDEISIMGATPVKERESV